MRSPRSISRLRRGDARSGPDRATGKSRRSPKLGDLCAKAQANPNAIPRRGFSEWTDRQGARPAITDPGREGMLDPLAEPLERNTSEIAPQEAQP